METKNYILLTILFLSISAFGQVDKIALDKIIDPELKEFKRQKIDTLFIYTEYCFGCMRSSDVEKDCEKLRLNNAYYFIWQKNGETFFKIRDNCFEYATLKLDTGFFDYIYSIKDTLINERLKDPKYSVDHASYSKIFLLDGINDFQLSFDGSYFFYGTDNPNVIYNNKTFQKHFWDNLEEYIAKDLTPQLIQSRQRKNYR